MAITLDDITKAAARIEGETVRTPLMQFSQLNQDCGRRVFVKPESLQRTGSFKFRGAYNRLLQLNDAERPAGVVAWSSGNHGQGVAAAAKLIGARATIVMPIDAPI
ncbi:MAG: pyridoxal-phosphate dependent enzyme, partial [Pseudomonadota bacterium]